MCIDIYHIGVLTDLSEFVFHPLQLILILSVAVELSYPSAVPHAATYRLTKSILTLLFHKTKLRQKIPEFNLRAVSSTLLNPSWICWFSSCRIYLHEFRLIIQLSQLDNLECISSVPTLLSVHVYVYPSAFIDLSKWDIIQIILNSIILQ